MSLEEIFSDVAHEMTRAIELQRAGKIIRTPSDLQSTNIESMNTLNEEVGEVHDEVTMLIASLLGLQGHSGNATRTVNNLEEMLFRYRLDPPSHIEEGDRVYISHQRAKLEQELTQVAAVACSFLMRLRDEAAKRT